MILKEVKVKVREQLIFFLGCLEILHLLQDYKAKQKKGGIL